MTYEGILNTKDYCHFTIKNDNNPEIITFSDASYAKGSLPGDTVLWDGIKCSFKERGHHDPLVGTLELASKTTYGLNKRGNPLYLFIPYNKSYPPFIVGSSEKDRSSNYLCLIKFENWDSSKSQFPRGSLEQLFGKSGDLKAEEEALRWFAFPWPSLRKKTVEIVPPKDSSEKRVHLEGLTFNIDPQGCKDIDDVLTFQKLTNYQWRIIITISDVAHYVEEMSAIDILASTFGQTLYKDGEAICPMLPPSYSEDACSLIKGKENVGVSLGFTWNSNESTIDNIQWYESIFTNNHTFTYEEFETVEIEERRILQDIASYLEKKDLTDSHTWIEAMMKFYNTEAGKLLKDVGVGILRSHTIPDMNRLEKYAKWDSKLTMLANSAAKYCLASELQTAHFGIGVNAYCHASSPIRRYADLMNQRILKQLIRRNKEGLFVTVLVEDLNIRSKAAKAYEKGLVFLRAVLSDVRTVSDARILDIQNTKITLWIPSWQKTITLKMKQNSENKFVSADEKIVYDLNEGDLVNLEFALNISARNWKDRMIITIVENSSL